MAAATPASTDIVEEIVKIPGFMRAKGWRNGAALMEEWFAGRAMVSPSFGPPDTTTIKMDSWVLTFGRAKTVYSQMINEKVWINEAAKKNITSLVRASQLLGTAPTTFGNLNSRVELVHDRYQVNFRPVSQGLGSALFDPLDDLFAALGAFELGCAIEANIYPAPAQKGRPAGPPYRVEIPRVGIYVRDSYDFNGSQPLGFWNFKTGDVSKIPGRDYHLVSNGTFGEWRKRHSMGGDFRIYSDIKTIALNPPQSFDIAS